MLAIQGSHEPGSETLAPRRSRSRWAALAAVAASCAIVPLAGATGAQAGEGYFCGNGGSGTYITLTNGQSCINPYYHTNYTVLTANRGTNGGTGTFCVGPSQSPTSLSFPTGNYNCATGDFAVWQGSSPGYAAYWISGGSGNFYGWFKYT